VVRVHPETGERTSVLGNFVPRFVSARRNDDVKTVRPVPVAYHGLTAPGNQQNVAGRWSGRDVFATGTTAPRSTNAVNDYGVTSRLFAAPHRWLRPASSMAAVQRYAVSRPEMPKPPIADCS